MVLKGFIMNEKDQRKGLERDLAILGRLRNDTVICPRFVIIIFHVTPSINTHYEHTALTQTTSFVSAWLLPVLWCLNRSVLMCLSSSPLFMSLSCPWHSSFSFLSFIVLVCNLYLCTLYIMPCILYQRPRRGFWNHWKLLFTAGGSIHRISVLQGGQFVSVAQSVGTETLGVTGNRSSVVVWFALLTWSWCYTSGTSLPYPCPDPNPTLP